MDESAAINPCSFTDSVTLTPSQVSVDCTLIAIDVPSFPIVAEIVEIDPSDIESSSYWKSVMLSSALVLK